MGAVNNNNGDSTHVMYREFSVLRESTSKEIDDVKKSIGSLKKEISEIHQYNKKVAEVLTKSDTQREFEKAISQNKNKVRVALIYAGVPIIASVVTYILTKVFG